jgi:hypothetical protein
MKISTHALAVVLTSMLVFSAPLHAQQQPATATVSGQSPEAAMAKARLDGEIAALNSGGWFGRSVAIGAVTGLIGTTITYAVAATSTPELPAEKKLAIANQSPDLQAIYEKGYADKVRARRKSTSLKGGLLGTVAFIVLVASSGS